MSGSGAGAGAVAGAAVAVAAVVVAVVDMVFVIPGCFFVVLSVLCNCLGRMVVSGLVETGSVEWG